MNGKMGFFVSKLQKAKIVIVGLDGAGKTTILYKVVLVVNKGPI